RKVLRAGAHDAQQRAFNRTSCFSGNPKEGRLRTGTQRSSCPRDVKPRRFVRECETGIAAFPRRSLRVPEPYHQTPEGTIGSDMPNLRCRRLLDAEREALLRSAPPLPPCQTLTGESRTEATRRCLSHLSQKIDYASTTEPLELNGMWSFELCGEHVLIPVFGFEDEAL